ncbi:MAG: type VI secretion system protein TssA [Novosphingobium sp.]|nr:type VI secretion system protein TssA [Novosphingobium sp.]
MAVRIDVDALVAPLSEEAPSGPDLYDDPERQQIETAFERSISEGESSGEGEELDWNSVNRLIAGQAERTRDLWLATYLMRGAAKAGDFDLVVQGAELLARYVEDRWDDVHPQLEELGFIGRKTPCESLTRLGEFLNPLRNVPIIQHSRLGSYSGADFERFASDGGNAENYGMFRALIDETPSEQLSEVVARLDALSDALKRADSVMTANAEGDTSTNFDPTYKVLREIRAAVSMYVPESESSEETMTDEVAESVGVVSAGTGKPAQSFSGAITNRKDVVRAIDSICDYYAKYEPGSPVPFALRRAKEWISLDFMALLEDIAPGGSTEAGQVLKLQRTSVGDSSSGSGSSNDSWSSGEESSSDDGW